MVFERTQRSHGAGCGVDSQRTAMLLVLLHPAVTALTVPATLRMSGTARDVVVGGGNFDMTRMQRDAATFKPALVHTSARITITITDN